MTPWDEIYNLLPIKWILIAGAAIWAYLRQKYLKEDRDQEKQQRIQAEVRSENLRRDNEVQIMAVQRAEIRGHNQTKYSKALEEVLSKVSPSSLNALQLDRVSEDPLSFSNLSADPGEPTDPGKKKDDQR